MDASFKKERDALARFSKLIQQNKLADFSDQLNPRQFSQNLDKELGYKISQIEKKLLKKYRAFNKTIDNSNKKKHFAGTETWIGLHPQVLQTPYSEIIHFFSYLKETSVKSIVDFGAGYGRIGIVLNALYPGAHFLGFEVVKDRSDEAQRVFDLLGLASCEVRNTNILDEDFIIPTADVYFIYDFSDPHDLRVILKKLSKKLYKEPFFLVAKGEGIRSLIQLKYSEFWNCNGVVHEENWSLYSSMTDLSIFKKNYERSDFR